jgi:hypothetical protein
MRVSRSAMPATPIRQAGAALVEDDQAREGRERLEKARRVLVLPLEVTVRKSAGSPGEIERPVANHLIGDRDVAGAGVANVRDHD